MKNFSSKSLLAIVGCTLVLAMSSCASYKTCPTYAKAQKTTIEKKANS